MYNGIIVVDKPQGWTSHDVVGKLRRILKMKRIGHGGTLDPLATGVLPVFVGRATRAADFISSADKVYIARFKLGIETDSQDRTGNTVCEKEVTQDIEAVKSVLPEFIGDIEQVPPMYSAIKKDGKKLYELARRGETVERAARAITIYRLELNSVVGDNEYEVLVHCSKGTYVRTLCHDIGQRLGCGAVLTELRRIRTGVFEVETAVTIEEIEAAADAGNAETVIHPTDSLFKEYPAAVVGKKQEFKCRNGASFPFEGEGKYRVYSEKGEFLMLGNCENKMMKTVKNFF